MQIIKNICKKLQIFTSKMSKNKYDNGDYECKTALQILSEKTNIPSQKTKALTLLHKARDKGNPEANYHLGLLRRLRKFNSNLNPEDYFLKACKDGHILSILELGRLYSSYALCDCDNPKCCKMCNINNFSEDAFKYFDEASKKGIEAAIEESKEFYIDLLVFRLNYKLCECGTKNFHSYNVCKNIEKQSC